MKSAIDANGSGRRWGAPRRALAGCATLMVLALGCSSSATTGTSTASTERATAPAPSTATPTSSTTTSAPGQEATVRDPACRPVAPEPPPPSEPTTEPSPIPGAEPVLDRRTTITDAVSFETGVTVTGDSAADGVPSILRVLDQPGPDASTLVQLDQCLLDATTVVSDGLVVAGVANPHGMVAVDLETAAVVFDGSFGNVFPIAATRLPTPRGAWTQEVNANGTMGVVRLFDAEAGVLRPPLYSEDDLSDRGGLPRVVDTAPGLVVVVGRIVWLLDPHDGTRHATWASTAAAEAQLLGGNDELVWIREPDQLVALDTETLTEQHRIGVPDLVRATYGHGRVWYVTVDRDALTGTIEGIDAATGAPVAIFDYQTETREGRGGTYVVTPSVRPDPEGVLFGDERTLGTYRLTVEG